MAPFPPGTRHHRLRPRPRSSSGGGGRRGSPRTCWRATPVSPACTKTTIWATWPSASNASSRRKSPQSRPERTALVRGCGQAYALQTVEPVTYRCGTRRVCQARSSGSERYTRARPHAVAPMNCVPEDSRRRSTCTGRTHSPRARADGNQTPSSTVAVRAPSPS